TSFASNLVTSPAGGGNVFMRDIQAGSTRLVSINSNGSGGGNSVSFNSAISSDGRFVAFESLASDLAAPPTGGTANVFARDMQSGRTSLVSINIAGSHGGNSSSQFPVISADGRFVAFVSVASDLVATDTNGASDVFARNILLTNACLKDSASGDVIQFNTQSGDYALTTCSSGVTISGTGVVRAFNGTVVISDFRPDRRVSITYLPNQLTGRAVINLLVATGIWQTITVNDTSSLGRPCSICGS